MRAWFPMAVGFVLLCAGDAHAQDLGATVRVGVGYDTNPVFVSVRNAAIPGTVDAAAPSAYTGAEASAELAAGSETHLTLSLDADARLYVTGHALSFERLVAGAATPLASRLLLVARLEASRFDTSLSSDEATTGRFRLGVRWTVDERLALGLALGAGVRAYDTGDQTDGLVPLGIDIRVVLGRRARISGGVDVERRESDVLRATRWEFAPWLAIALDPARAVRFVASYALYVRSFDIDRRSGVEHVARIDATWMPWPALGFFASLEGGFARGNPEALRYERLDALIGLRAALDTASPPAAVGRAEDESGNARPMAPDGPASAGARRGSVHFRVEAPDATRVAVVGTFNDWSERGGALRQSAPGVFEGDVAVRPGHHRYHLLVDGEPMRPAGAGRYVDDGFGGEDAVIEVPRH